MQNGISLVQSELLIVKNLLDYWKSSKFLTIEPF